MQIVSLVTGGAGFIGSHVTDHLIELGHQVVVLDDLSGGNQNNVNSNARFVKGSITDVNLINELFEEYKFDYVYHLAAYAAEGLSHFIRRFNYENNLLGSINLINAAVNYQVKCFVFTSSIAVYGTNELPLSETQIPQPEDPYGIAKYAVEMDLKNAKEMFDLDSIIFRPHNVYGSRQNVGDKYRNVIGIFMNQLLQNEPLTIFGDGNQTRAFTHIDDVAPYIAQSVNVEKAYNEVFNIGSDVPFSVNNLAQKVKEHLEVDTEILHLEERNEVIHAYASHQKFKNIFNPKSTVDIDTGLKEMADWIKLNGAVQSTHFESIEIEKNMPPVWNKVVSYE